MMGTTITDEAPAATGKWRRTFMLLLALVLTATLPLLAGVPQPATVIYGVVRDAYGCPYDKGAEIAMLNAGQEVARSSVGGLLPGIANYRLRLDMDSGSTPYAAYAVQTGNALNVVVDVGGIRRPTIPGGDIAAPSSGARLRLDLITGTDSDGDGLPDEWEQFLIDQSGGQLNSLSGVRPNDDFDGDGMSNRDEFQAGTYPFLPTDVLMVESVERVNADGRLKVRFLTSPQRVYHVMGVSELEGNSSWLPLSFATQEDGPCSYQTLTGDGAHMTIYLDPSPYENALFIRLGVE